MHVWKSKENLLELVLFFHHVGSWDLAPVTKFSSKHLHLLSQLATFLRHFCFLPGPAFHSLGPTQILLQMNFSLISVELLKTLFVCIWLKHTIMQYYLTTFSY